MNTTPSFFWTFMLALGLCAVGCFPEQDPNADNGGAPGSGGTTSHPQGGKAATGKAGSAHGGSDATATDGGNSAASTPEAGSADAGGGYVETRQLVETCEPPNTSIALPQRQAVTTNDAQTANIPILVNDLWGSFNTHCGHCHVDGANGGYQVARNSFSALVTQSVVDTWIKASDPTLAMPRGSEGSGPDTGIGFDTRPAGDAIVALAASLTQWIAAGSPSDLFYIPNPDYGKQSLYLMTPDVASGLTNLGSCVPAGNFTFGWGVDRHQKMQQLDGLFAKAARVAPASPGQPTTPADQQTGLPLHLSETDLFTFDSQELSRYGVVAFAPAYPLWSDGSGKLRYVRVPLGQSIEFDKNTQEFTIPPNTRFYKTFMKEVVDRGSQLKRNRKIETRLIVSRPDNSPGDPGALFGTYVWNEDETEATLLGHDAATDSDEVLRDLTPFPDKILTYYTDEPAADAIRFADPPPKNETFALEQAQVLRHYVLPGKERCRECHMGSVRSDFVLGFTPMQISRRPVNQGGIIEDAGPDELTQLDRLSALGVITGVGSAADIDLLENSEAEKPRNDSELIAQGYMFGNCAHCHNPNGYATSSVPELGPLLDFWPRKNGGIFHFPLDRMSPRTSRGTEGRAVPYITPSLYDLLPYGYTVQPVRANSDYYPKFFNDIAADGSAVFDLAPWRSLIYRNTQTPFLYGDDLTIFPHMPLNTSGYDCRASQIFGTWMASIPAVRANPTVEETYVGDVTGGIGSGLNPFPGDPRIDNSPQPYLEVSTSDTNYSDAVTAATARVDAFQHGMRYGTCPSNADVIDLTLAPEGQLDPPPGDTVDPKDGVPDHTHFVATDLSESPGPWSPRGTTWNQILVQHDFPNAFDPTVKQVVYLLTGDLGVGGASSGGGGSGPAASGGAGVAGRAGSGGDSVAALQGVTFEQKDKELYTFVSTPRPFAPWQVNQKCDFTKPPLNRLAQTYIGDSRPRWFDMAKVAPDVPIMEKLPGGNIYDMICTNCHGPKMDSKGRQADTVQQLTGGNSRVPDFLTGLFGPLASPGTARGGPNGFGSVATSAVTIDDWGARYMSWMALGGTSATIPKLVLNLVGATLVAGTKRTTPLVDHSDLSANMLLAAKNACKALYNNVVNATPDAATAANRFGVPLDYAPYPLIQTNGDAELWEQLCTINNPPLVRAILVPKKGTPSFGTLYESTAYPANTVVGKQGGQIVMSSPSGGVTDDNHVPWCVQPAPAADADWQAVVAKFLADNTVSGHPPPPLCPAELLPTTLQVNGTRLDDFALRGAINAGFAVFYYLDQVSKGSKASNGPVNTARFDECTLAPPSP